MSYAYWKILFIICCMLGGFYVGNLKGSIDSFIKFQTQENFYQNKIDENVATYVKQQIKFNDSFIELDKKHKEDIEKQNEKIEVLQRNVDSLQKANSFLRKIQKDKK